jgi:hypothetical protein
MHLFIFVIFNLMNNALIIFMIFNLMINMSVQCKDLVITIILHINSIL